MNNRFEATNNLSWPTVLLGGFSVGAIDSYLQYTARHCIMCVKSLSEARRVSKNEKGSIKVVAVVLNAEKFGSNEIEDFYKKMVSTNILILPVSNDKNKRKKRQYKKSTDFVTTLEAISIVAKKIIENTPTL